jgi:Uma2 family endonuclease
MNIPVLREIDYPESDGKPMAETPIHMQVMWDVINMLIAWFANRRRVYVWGNMFLYYVLGDSRKNVSPDVMVVKGVAKERRRRVFKVWEENNRTPSVMIEITSRKTRREDTGKKYTLYQDVLKVREYFLFDPLCEYLNPPLKGYRLRGGVYQEISAVEGRLPSQELGLHLEAHGEELRLWDPSTQQWLPTMAEERQQAQIARETLQRAEAALEHAAVETQRIRAELEAIKKQLKNKAE